MTYDLIVFDLDGTLVDSFADIHESVNEFLCSYGGAALSKDTVRRGIGRGVRHLVSSCLSASGLTGCDPDACLSAYTEIYVRNCLIHSVLYDGVMDGLLRLAPLPLAVLSNKPEQACRTILCGLGVEALFVRIAGGDSFPELKPSPLPLLRIAEERGVSIGRMLMVGDSEYDIAAAHAAGCDACAVTWGFQDVETLKALDPNYLVSAFEEIIGIADGRAATVVS
jgi:phosphoglycolate phosphatase